jgi:hypothetical protein
MNIKNKLIMLAFLGQISFVTAAELAKPKTLEGLVTELEAVKDDQSFAEKEKEIFTLLDTMIEHKQDADANLLVQDLLEKIKLNDKLFRLFEVLASHIREWSIKKRLQLSGPNLARLCTLANIKTDAIKMMELAIQSGLDAANPEVVRDSVADYQEKNKSLLENRTIAYIREYQREYAEFSLSGLVYLLYVK